MTSNPRIDAARNGAIEKAKIPSKASRKRRIALYLLRPAARGALSMATPVWRKPTQLNIPRR